MVLPLKLKRASGLTGSSSATRIRPWPRVAPVLTPEKKIVVAEVNFADSCAREDRQKTADSLTRFCKEHMDIDLSLYLSL